MAEQKIKKGSAEDPTIGRETVLKVPRRKPRELYGVCVKPDDDLIAGKIYKLKVSGDLAGVTDEYGEAAVYPLDFFLELPLTKNARNTLAEVVG